MLASLGLAARARRVRAGFDAVSEAMKRGEARAVLVAADAPAGVRQKIMRLAESLDKPCAVVVDGDQLGRAIGRTRVVVLAVTDPSLGRRSLELAEDLKASG